MLDVVVVERTRFMFHIQVTDDMNSSVILLASTLNYHVLVEGLVLAYLTYVEAEIAPYPKGPMLVLLLGCPSYGSFF